jgi:hypothetical protein
MHAADPAVDTVQRDVVGFSSGHAAASVGNRDFRTVELITLELTFEWFCKAEPDLANSWGNLPARTRETGRQVSGANLLDRAADVFSVVLTLPSLGTSRRRH